MNDTCTHVHTHTKTLTMTTFTLVADEMAACIDGYIISTTKITTQMHCGGGARELIMVIVLTRMATVM